MKEAGFVKVATALDVLKRAWTKASHEERESFLAWVEEDLDESPKLRPPGANPHLAGRSSGEEI
jgi:hypothetical protein